MTTKMPTKTIVLISCSNIKRETAATAAELYTSQLFIASRTYAENNGDGYAILSARHGLLMPTATVEPYDHKLGGSADARRVWGSRVQADILELCDYHDITRDRGRVLARFIILAGRNYCEALPKWMQAAATFPLAGKQIGERLQWLSRENQRQAAPPRCRQGLLFV